MGHTLLLRWHGDPPSSQLHDDRRLSVSSGKASKGSPLRHEVWQLHTSRCWLGIQLTTYRMESQRSTAFARKNSSDDSKVAIHWCHRDRPSYTDWSSGV